MRSKSLPVIVYDGGPIPTGLERAAFALGTQVLPCVEGVVLDRPCVLAGPALLMPGVFCRGGRGYLEYGIGCAMASRAALVLDTVADGGLALSAGCDAMLNGDPALVMGAAIHRLCPALDGVLVELALAEAIANAVIHGNLGLESDLRQSLAGLAEFNARITQRLADMRLASRHVCITALPQTDGGVRVTVADDGDGFDIQTALARPVDFAAKSGRGLGLMKKISTRVEGLPDGRGVILWFSPPYEKRVG